MTSKKSHADFQELTTHEDMEAKLETIYLSTSDIIIEDDVKQSNDNFMKKVNCKHADHKGFRTRDENLNCATSIEKKSIH